MGALNRAPLRRPLTSVLGASAPAHRIIGGKIDMPLAPAYAHGRLKAMYGDTPA